MPPKTITIIGSLNTDLVTLTPRVPSGGETLTATSFTTGPGGKGANQAVASMRLSRPKPHKSSPTPPSKSPPTQDPNPITVTVIGSVGLDEFGPAILAGLQNDGIDTTGITTSTTHKTGVAVILVEQSTGENRILLSPGANHSLLPSQFLLPSSLGSPKLPDLIILQLEIPLPTILQIIHTAKTAGVDILLNPAPAVPLPDSIYENLAHLILNETEAALLTSRTLTSVSAPEFNWSVITSEFLQKGVQNIVITLGAKGAFFASRDGEGNGEGIMVQSEKVERVVDTTAAGDTFVGAYAVGVVRSGRKGVGSEDVRKACRAAGRTVEREGAQSAIPWADEVERRVV